MICLCFVVAGDCLLGFGLVVVVLALVLGCLLVVCLLGLLLLCGFL